MTPDKGHGLVSPETFAKRAGMNPKTVLAMIGDRVLTAYDGPRGTLVSTSQIELAKTERGNRAAAALLPSETVTVPRDKPKRGSLDAAAAQARQKNRSVAAPPVQHHGRKQRELWVTASQLAEQIGCGTTTIHRYVRVGRITGERREQSSRSKRKVLKFNRAEQAAAAEAYAQAHEHTKKPKPHVAESNRQNAAMRHGEAVPSQPEAERTDEPVGTDAPEEREPNQDLADSLATVLASSHQYQPPKRDRGAVTALKVGTIRHRDTGYKAQQAELARGVDRLVSVLCMIEHHMAVITEPKPRWWQRLMWWR